MDPGSLVVRPRLQEQMHAAAAHKVTLLSAPAGYGKTTLLRSWAASRADPTIWLALDPRDNDSTRLARYLAGACHEAGIEGIDPSQVRSPGQVIPRMINAIADHERSVALVLDDAHAVDSVAAVQAFTYLLEQLPANAHLVVSSRLEPPLPFARIRAHGGLAELRSADLRFTLEEIAEFVEVRTGNKLPLDLALRLQEKTEGWPAAMQLVAHLLRSGHGLEAILDTFSGDHPYLLDYLSGEVLASLPDEVTSFLLETSILPEMEVELCQQLTGQANCQQLLEQLHRDNLFLEPIGPAHTRFRYHALFQEQLKRRLKATVDRAKWVGLHQRACQALVARGQIQEAIPHAIEAGSFDLAAQLISDRAQAAMNAGDVGSLARWLSAMPDEIVRASPQLAIWQAWSLTLGGQLSEVEDWLSAAEAGVSDSIGFDLGGQELTIRSMVERFRGNPSAAAVLAERAIETMDGTRPILRAIAKLNLGHAYLSSGRPRQAEQPLVDAVGEARALDHRYVAVSAQFHLGKSYLQRGMLDHARQTFESAGLAGARPREAAPRSVSNLGLALLALERDDLSTANQHLGQAIHLSQWIGDHVFICESQQALVQFYLANQDGRRATQALSVLARHLERAGDQRTQQRDLAALRAQVDALNGDRLSPARWAQRTLEAAAANPQTLDIEQLTTAVGLLMPTSPVEQDRPELQVWHALLKQAEFEAEMHQLRLLALRARLLRASLLHQLGRRAQAATLVRRTLQGCPAGWVRPFLMAGAPMLEVLQSLRRESTDDQELNDWLDALQAAFTRHGIAAQSPGPAPVAAEPADEGLTEREVEVLALLAEGRNSREVAEELVIAFNTARTHIRNIYSKLDVHNRVQAVDRARQFQLV